VLVTLFSRRIPCHDLAVALYGGDRLCEASRQMPKMCRARRNEAIYCRFDSCTVHCISQDAQRVNAASFVGNDTTIKRFILRDNPICREPFQRASSTPFT
jgi:hypothetical protein